MAVQGRGRRALVVGLGVAGISAALRLRQVGWEVVVVERAPQRRSGGYFIGLFGSGAASAERLGVLDAIGDRRAPDSVVYEVDRAGRRHRGMGFSDLPNRPRMLLRGDVEAGLFEALPSEVEIRFSTVPTRIVQDAEKAEVTLHDQTAGTSVTERFDLVVGADGLRSTVRRLVFGPDANHMHSLDHIIAATLLDEQVGGFGPHDGVVLAEVGRAAWIWPFADRGPSMLFTYHTDDIDGQFRRPAIESLRRAFGPRPAGPLLGEMLDRFEKTDNFLFDSVHQVRMRQWHHDRVVLLGDAAWCMTLYSGLGTSAALAGGELLGTMLEHHHDDIPAALGDWERRMRPYIDFQYDHLGPERLLFVPATRTQQVVRSTLLRMRWAPVVGPALEHLMAGSNLMKMKNVDVAAA
ncbi:MULTISPECIES: FAD-dependent monooxygenase [Streptomyces]|uniref:FAD-dependent monooxygenase n=1 Tax=Streptomyces TaxID=1883 RepID=UPI001F16A2EC|nr:MULTISPECIES: FAD-dependent monooxygenase [Streptomyces]MCF2130960.1 FAD-dependent monooxygenase [Streptomyces sp. STD 3.1]WGK50908.1 FAD-dependent monooxygenase [Streptomyces sp. B146]